MTKKYTRRSFLKYAASLFTTSVIASSFGYFYARYVEPKQLAFSTYSIPHAKVPTSFDGVRIIQFSDTHLGHFFDLDRLSEVVDEINRKKPDIVFFTGDLMDAPNAFPYAEDIVPILSKINAPLGKFSIYGNHDHGGYGSDIYKNIMALSDFHLLSNSHHLIKSEGGEEIIIAGLDDVMLGRPDFQYTFKNMNPDLYTIMLVHEPDVAPSSEMYGADLQLSGHSHGGQIQLPFIGPIVTPPLATDYYEGKYEIGPTAMPLFVNRGLGTTRLPFRFMSKPEISIYTLKKA
ncbi:metallophosphoesterase [Bacillus timonensis]|nr:metallophosphoesterase [Bacillus timonensis]